MEQEDRLADSDLRYALSYNPQDGFTTNDIKHVHAAVYGENDGADWYWIAEMNDGRIFLISGGCDYTGWDCQSSAHSELVDSKEAAVELADKWQKADNADYGNDQRKIAEALRNQIDGKQPFGTIITDYSVKDE